MLDFRGIALFTEFAQSNSVAIADLPTCLGIYAEVYWPAKGLRIGETGRSIRGKIRHDVRWFTAMQNGTAPTSQLRRTLPIAMAAKETGVEGFAFYVVSRDARLGDKALRQEAERRMFEWAAESPDFESWNHQRSWR